MAKTNMLLFKKTMQVKEGEKKGQTFDTYFMKFPKGEVFISTKLTKECMAKLLLSGVQFPMEITLAYEQDEINPETNVITKVGQKDYFITTEMYKNQYGEDTLKDVCVVQDFRNVKHLELSSKSLDDYFLEATKGVDATSANNQ